MLNNIYKLINSIKSKKTILPPITINSSIINYLSKLQFLVDPSVTSLLLFVILVALKSLILILLLLGTIAFYILVERHILGAIQRRKGPNVTGSYGLLQSIADGLKLISKETPIPSSSNTSIFLMSPIVSFFIGIAVWGVIPFGEGAVISNINLGVLYLFAISGIAVFSIIMSGWSSNSKYSFLGAIRSAAQMLSYEICFGLCLLCVAILTESFNLSEIVYYQQKVMWSFAPLFPIFIIFFISTLAETNRHPFDLPEAESELVSGFNLEYGSMLFALFFLGEYASILNMCALCVTLFFGGWDPIFSSLSFIPAPLWFGIKVWILGAIFIIVRGVLPRFRFDQLIAVGWRVFIPFCIGYVFFIAFFVEITAGMEGFF
jgi:NADH-quinone oxidoreductase subunit H